jgi:pterin-4a-carbinolamine dehydratase
MRRSSKTPVRRRPRAGKSPTRPRARPLTRLKAERVQDALRALPGWRLLRSGAAITRAFRFRSAETPLLFAALVGALAREGCHPPPAITVYDREVVCRLASPESGGVTRADIRLARRISLLEK